MAVILTYPYLMLKKQTTSTLYSYVRALFWIHKEDIAQSPSLKGVQQHGHQPWCGRLVAGMAEPGCLETMRVDLIGRRKAVQIQTRETIKIQI